MSLEETTNHDSLSKRLDSLASDHRERFLAELQANRNPRIEVFLEGQDDYARPVILRALILAEFQWRRDHGQAPDLNDLLQRFPGETRLIGEILSDGSTETIPHQATADANHDPVANAGDRPRLPTESRSRYKVLRQHAVGGLGIVNLAVDQELHRDVALKEIRLDSADHEQYRARFIREAEVTARLEHPGIVPVYGIGYYEDGRPFYIMRFIRGETLKAAILRLHGIKSKSAPAQDPDPSKQIRYTLATLVGRLIDACHALAYAHHRKVLHRDVKPDNIMLGPYGETLVVDWGLAKTIDDPEHDEDDDEPTLWPEADSQVTPTRIGSKIGTVGYMSPEQAAGALSQLRPASDVYSLGVTLFYIMTGKTPFEGCGAEEFLARSRKGLFRKPSEVKPSVPKALEAICLKAMAVIPEERYSTAEGLAEDLERWRAGEPVDCYPEPPIDRLARWSKKHRTGLAAGAVLLVCSTIGLAFFSVQEHRQNERSRLEVAITRAAEAEERHAKEVARDATAAAIEDREAAQRALKLTRQSLRQLMENLSGPTLSYLQNSGGARLGMSQAVLKFYQELIVKHPDDPDVKYELAIACRNTANIARSVGHYKDAEQLYTQSTELLKTLLSESPGSDDFRIELIQTTIDEGANLTMSGRPRDGQARGLRALAIIAERKNSAPDDDRFRKAEALALLDLASSRLTMSRPAEALTDAGKSFDLLTKLGEKPGSSPIDQLYRVLALVDRALARDETGDRAQAWNDLSQAAEITTRLLKNPELDNPDLRFAEVLVFSRQGRLYALENRHDESLKAYELAMERLLVIYRNNFRSISIDREMVVVTLGRAEARLELLEPAADPAKLQKIQNEFDKAQLTLSQCLTYWNDDHYYHALYAQNLEGFSRLALARKDKARAREWLKKSIEQMDLACQLNQDDRSYVESRTRIGEQLKTLEADRPSTEAQP